MRVCVYIYVYTVHVFIHTHTFVFASRTLISAEQWPIPGSLKSRMWLAEEGTRAGIKSRRSPTAFRNWMSNWESGCGEDSSQTPEGQWGQADGWDKQRFITLYIYKNMVISNNSCNKKKCIHPTWIHILDFFYWMTIINKVLTNIKVH